MFKIQIIKNQNSITRRMRILVSVLAFLCGIHSCEKGPNPDDGPKEFLTITTKPTQAYQTIHNFGASDAWSCQFIGKNWPLSKRNQMADLLFSVKMKSDGSPAGIGLSSWRMNLGGGSSEQGSGSGIQDEWRRSESFMNSDKTYDWNKQKGQRWFVKAAKDRGVDYFTAFVNSPPVALTKNGKAYSSGGKSANISEEYYPEFAEYLVRIVDEIESKDGVHFDYLSPFNEPQWDWTNSGQEGSPWLNTEMASFTRALNQEITDSDIDIKIEIAEAAQIQYLYSSYNRPGRGDQIVAFFDEKSDTYVGNLDHVAQQIAGHSYFTTWDLSHFLDTRKLLASKLSQYPEVEYIMSEYTLLENNEVVRGQGRDLGIIPALYMARVIHADLTLAGASSWQWWLAISPYDYKDGLIYTTLNKSDGTVYESKMLWALGNYSRFIRPGMIRIGVHRDDLRSLEQTTGGVMISSFQDPITGKTITVALNYGSNSIPVKINKDSDAILCRLYRTSAGNENLKFITETSFEEPIRLAPQSITTFVEQ